MNFELRLEQASDHRTVEELTREAFWNLHVPGCDEHYLTHMLRNHPDIIPDLCFVAVANDAVVGMIQYTRATVGNKPVLCFGPIAVHPDYQRQGIGKALIAHTKQLAAARGDRAILIYGHPMHYLSSGFVPASEYGITTAEGKFHPALLAMEVTPGGLSGISGRFQESPAYQVDPAAAAEFDKAFPYKEKVTGTPSQVAFARMSQQ